MKKLLLITLLLPSALFAMDPSQHQKICNKIHRGMIGFAQAYADSPGYANAVLEYKLYKSISEPIEAKKQEKCKKIHRQMLRFAQEYKDYPGYASMTLECTISALVTELYEKLPEALTKVSSINALLLEKLNK